MLDLDLYLAAIGAGDPEAFARWVAGAEPSLRATLRPMAAHVDAEAVLQEALLRVWQVAPRCQPDGRPNSLLRLGARIARNLAIDELRHNRATAIDPETLASLDNDARAGSHR
jgi:RNA polymerase sigma-70 factor (ECF subfamily)